MEKKFGLPLIRDGQQVSYNANKVIVLNGSDEAFLNNPKISADAKEEFMNQRFLAARKAGFSGTLIQFAKEFAAPDEEKKRDLVKYENSVSCGYKKSFETYLREILKK